MDWKEWTGIVLWLNASYPDQKIEPATAKAWFEDLELEDAATVAVALRRCRRISAFRPQLASILEICGEVRRERAIATREQAEDATRTCPGCCTEDLPGWIQTDSGYHPCGDCRPGRYEAFQRTRESGWPTSKTGKNWMAVEHDKATGYPKTREGARP